MIIVWAREPKEALIKIFNYHLKHFKMSILLLIKGSFEYKFGVGKSYLALKLGEIFDRDFGIHKVIFEPKDFKKVMSEIEGKKYQTIVIDEAGILVNAKRWQSFINQSVRAAMMTFRNLQSMCILVSPAFKYIDSDIRRMITFMAETEKFIKTTTGGNSFDCFVKAMFYKINWSDMEDKYYHARLLYFKHGTKELNFIGPLKIGLPSPELVEAYEERAEIYKRKIRSMVEDLEDFVPKTYEPNEIIQDILNNRRDLIINNKVAVSDIKITYDVSNDVATYVARRVNNILKGGKSE